MQELNGENSQLVLQAETADQRRLAEVAGVQAELAQERALCAQLRASLDRAQQEVDKLAHTEALLNTALQDLEHAKVWSLFF